MTSHNPLNIRQISFIKALRKHADALAQMDHLLELLVTVKKKVDSGRKLKVSEKKAPILFFNKIIEVAGFLSV